MALARSVPATVLASALGLDDAAATEAASLAGVVAAALAPRPDTDPGRSDADGDDAARALAALLTPVARGSGSRTDAVAAAMATLVQAGDATAGLIGNALVAWARLPAGPVDPAPLVERVLRHDPPVHWTRRTGMAHTDLGGQHIEPGESLWLLLAPAGAAAGAGPDPEAGNPATTFGSGPHRCPGRHLAIALARGVLAAVADRQLRPVVADPPGYEPRPNIRIPTAVALRPA
jgi:cytochrome P450